MEVSLEVQVHDEITCILYPLSRIISLISPYHLYQQTKGVSAPAFAKMFGMSTTEAVVFLEWIKVGVKFKEETLDTAKKAGLG